MYILLIKKFSNKQECNVLFFISNIFLHFIYTSDSWYINALRKNTPWCKLKTGIPSMQHFINKNIYRWCFMWWIPFWGRKLICNCNKNLAIICNWAFYVYQLLIQQKIRSFTTTLYTTLPELIPALYRNPCKEIIINHIFNHIWL